MRTAQLVFLFVSFAIAKNCIYAQEKYTEILTTEPLKTYVDAFNASDEELHRQEFPNAKSFDFLAENIPLFECPDKNVERTYYFRWWT